MLKLSLMPVRVGVVGLGGVADRIHLPACAAVAGLEIVAAADPNPDTRRAMAAKFPIGATFESFDAMLAAGGMDMIIVGTPPGTHFDICKQALEAGLHVFCEKPFMQTVEQADAIVEVAREKNLLLRVNNQYRFMSYYAETKRRLAAGEFGRPFYIQAWQQMYHPPAKETNWRSTLKQYLIFEFGTHAFDLASFFFDDAIPESVTAHTPRALPEFDADILVQATLRYPEERLAAFSFNRVSHAPEKYLEMRIDCEKASLRISLGGVARFSVDWAKNSRRFTVKHGFVRGGQARAEVKGLSRTYWNAKKPEFATATAEHLKVFVSEMNLSQRPVSAAQHAREILNLVFAAYESANRGETVRPNR